MAKLMKFGEHVPGDQVYNFSERKVKTFPLTGDPDAWILDVDDPECVSNAVKYQGWGLLLPETYQGPVICNADGHDKPADFLFKQISDIEIKLRIVAPDYPHRAKAIREAKEAGLRIATISYPDAVEALGIKPPVFQEEAPAPETTGAKKDVKANGKDKAK
jgi:hypothetical protein